MLALDHLVIAARHLDEAVAWCERTFGVTPGPGGRHALMSTHNRLLPLGAAPGAPYPRSYLECIAIDPEAPPPGRARWFALDEAAMQARLAHGPRLVHAVLRVAGPAASTGGEALAALREQFLRTGHDPGHVLQAARDTPAGRLAWHITVRDDGALPCGGALPTLIAWEGAHPCDAMPAAAQGVLQLHQLSLAGLPGSVTQALRAAGLPPSLRLADGPTATTAAITAVIDSPRGLVTLRSGPAVPA